MRKGIPLVLLFFLVLAPWSAPAGVTVAPGSVLSLQECIDIALSRHPEIAAAVHTVRVGDSRIGQAQSDYFPQVHLQTSYDRSRPYQSGSSRLSGSSANDQYMGRIALSQNIYDFGRTSARVEIAGLNRDSSRHDLESIRTLVVLNVKQSYYTALQADENRRVADETVAQFRKHLDRAKSFYEVGLKPKFDVTKAEVDVSNARLNLIKAENALRLARTNLNNAIGVPDAAGYTLENQLQYEKVDLNFEAVLQKAFENRADLRALLLRQAAAHASLDLARAGHYPTLTGSAGYGRGGSDFPLGEGWNVGASVNIPVFSGFYVENQISESKATIDVLAANIEATKQRIRLEIEQAMSGIREGAVRIDAAEWTVRQARENLELAEGRYASGVGNPIEVSDALLVLSNARTDHVAALTDYRNALAAMEWAMGMR